jgi:signal peptidase II
MQKSFNPRIIKSAKTQLFVFILLTSLGFFVDRLLKYLAREKFSLKEIFIIPKILSFSFYENSGLAFSLKFPPLLIVTASGLILFFLLVLSVHGFMRKKPYFFPSWLIILGGLSNFIDRLKFGATLDYLYLRPYSFINLADLYILAGCLLWFYLLWHKKKINYGQ